VSEALRPGLLQRIPPVQKVAVLRATRIGDFICATPFLRLLRNALPQAHITLITLPVLHALAERLDSVDLVTDFPGYPGLAEQLFKPRRAVRFLQDMQDRVFDLAIQVQGSGVYSNPFTLLLGARYTAGFIRPEDPPGRLDAALPLPVTGHEVQRVLAMAAFLGLPAGNGPLEYPLRQTDHTQAAALLAGLEQPLIGLHPSARDQSRRWPPPRFAAVGRALWERYGGTLVGLGESEEHSLLAQILEQAAVPAVNLAGRTSLPVLGAVIQRLAVLVTNDTGPAHIAYALKIPAVVIFGGGDPQRYGPYQPGPFKILAHPVDCRPCGYATCPLDSPCIERIDPQAVITAATALMD
jgi:ADP-heptose:LPS heptosyltransferase